MRANAPKRLNINLSFGFNSLKDSLYHESDTKELPEGNSQSTIAEGNFFVDDREGAVYQGVKPKTQVINVSSILPTPDAMA